MTELTLYRGDCLEVMKEIPDHSIDLIICDLPFGCLVNNHKQRPLYDKGRSDGIRQPSAMLVGCAWDVKIDLDRFWKEIRRIRRSDHSPTLHFTTVSYGHELINSNPKEFRYDLIWDKGRCASFLNANKTPLRSHELIYVFSKAGAHYERINDELDRCPLSVIHMKKGNRIGAHPTEKPTDLYRWLIDRYCPPGGVVLDPTFGSGNSVFTAYLSGRSAIGIEKDEAFFAKAEERLHHL